MKTQHFLEMEEKIKSRLEKTSDRFRLMFLLKFTEQLIKHTQAEEFFKLQNLLNKKEKRLKIEEKNENREELMPSIMHSQPVRRYRILSKPALIIPQASAARAMPRASNISAIPSNSPVNIMPMSRQRQPLRIPEIPLPPTVRNVIPFPDSTQIELGKLNTLIQNPRTMSIECNGPEENIVVKGQMGAQTTNVLLNKEEIDGILNSFSRATKIPIHEGVYKIAVGNLVISAIVSELIGSKFIIRKMIPQMRY